MQTRQRHNFTRVELLREDADLGAVIPAAELVSASEHCVAPAITVPKGAWNIDRFQTVAGGVGLLVLEGLLLRRVGIDGRFGGELLGEGDLLQPWRGHLDSTLPHTTGFRVISKARIAILDERVAIRIARYPELIGALTGRALDRSRRLALMMAIVHHPRIEVRLHMLLWHLADRWGYVRTNGVVLPLQLSHTVLADLVAAQRPSVTGALGKLSQRGLIESVETGWLLCGDPPGELLELQDVEVREGATAAPSESTA